MRDCWIEHDKCAINCPCNENCPDGCPEQFDGHECKTYFCQNIKDPFERTCKEQSDRDREPCASNDEYDCVNNKKCCWTPFYPDNQGVPWCHQPEYVIIDLPTH